MPLSDGHVEQEATWRTRQEGRRTRAIGTHLWDRNGEDRGCPFPPVRKTELSLGSEIMMCHVLAHWRGKFEPKTGGYIDTKLRFSISFIPLWQRYGRKAPHRNHWPQRGDSQTASRRHWNEVKPSLHIWIPYPGAFTRLQIRLAQWVGVVLSQGLAEIIQNMSSRMQSASNQRIFGID